MPSRFKVILRTDDTIELDREAVTLVEARLAPIDENENIRQKAEDNKRKQSELERRPTFSEPEGTRMKMNPKTFVRVLPTVGGPKDKDKINPKNVSVVTVQPTNNLTFLGSSKEPLDTLQPLDWLDKADKLFINQYFTMYRILPACGTANKYCIKSAAGTKYLEAVEESEFRDRILCGPYRPFELKIFDGETEIIRYSRSMESGSCFFLLKMQKMEVTDAKGTLIGCVEQEPTYLVPKFLLKDAAGETVLMIKGPKFTISWGRNVDFNVLTPKEEQIGKIVKLWGGFTREAFTDVDNFKLEFPVTLPIDTKKILIGACFLIDYMYFEMYGNGK